MLDVTKLCTESWIAVSEKNPARCLVISGILSVSKIAYFLQQSGKNKENNKDNDMSKDILFMMKSLSIAQYSKYSNITNCSNFGSPKACTIHYMVLVGRRDDWKVQKRIIVDSVKVNEAELYPVHAIPIRWILTMKIIMALLLILHIFLHRIQWKQCFELEQHLFKLQIFLICFGFVVCKVRGEIWLSEARKPWKKVQLLLIETW